MLRTGDVCMAYEVYAWRIYGVCTILICGVSVIYKLLLIPMKTNAYVHFIQFAHCSYQLSEVEGATGEI